MKRIVVLFLAWALLITFFTSCANNSSSSLTDGSDVSQSLPPEAGSLSLPYSGCKIFDPLTTDSWLDQALTPLIFDSVCRVKDNFEAERQLASSVNKSDYLITVTLRNDIAFHDGSALTAADAVYSAQRILNAVYSPYKSLFANVVSVSVRDTHTFSVELSDAESDYMRLLCFPVVKKGSGQQTDAVGTGPYAFFNTNGGRSLKAFFSSLPYAQVTLEPVKDAVELCRLFEKGKITCMAVDAMTSENISPICSYQTVRASRGIGHILGFSCSGSSFSDGELRKAIARLVPRKAICTYVLCGACTPGTSWIVPDAVIGLPAEDEMTEEEALRIVRSVNAAERTEVSLLYCSDTWIRGQEAYYLADFLNELGFACVLNPKGEAEYVKALRNGDFDLAIMRSSLRSVSDLYELCSSSGSENVFKFTDPEVDTDLQLLMIEDPDLQQEAAGPLASALDANPPFLPIGYEQSVVYLRQGNLSSLHPLPDAPYGNPKDWIPAES